MSLERRVAQSFMHAGQIPTPDFNTIGDIDRAIKFLSKNPAVKEKICETLVYQVRSLVWNNDRSSRLFSAEIHMFAH